MVNKNTLGNASANCPHQDGNIDDILKDPAKRSENLKKLGLPNPSVLTPSGKAIGGGGFLPPLWCPFYNEPTLESGARAHGGAFSPATCDS